MVQPVVNSDAPPVSLPTKSARLIDDPQCLSLPGDADGPCLGLVRSSFPIVPEPHYLSICSFFSYVPWFQSIFLTRGISAEFFFLPMACVPFSLPTPNYERCSFRRIGTVACSSSSTKRGNGGFAGIPSRWLLTSRGDGSINTCNTNSLCNPYRIVQAIRIPAQELSCPSVQTSPPCRPGRHLQRPRRPHIPLGACPARAR
jgi:hypothetical protein